MGRDQQGNKQRATVYFIELSDMKAQRVGQGVLYPDSEPLAAIEHVVDVSLESQQTSSIEDMHHKLQRI